MAIIFAGCSGPSAPSRANEIKVLETPAPPKSEASNITVSPNGTIYLSWMQQTENDAPALRYAQLDPANGKWSAPVSVVEGENLLANSADFPTMLATRSGRILAQWLQINGDGPFTYDSMVAQSDDGGKTWSPSRVLHDDGKQAEHGFVSLVESSTGEAEAIWLDGRNTVAPTPNPETQLGFTTIADDGVPGATQLVDTRICDCCHTSAALTAAGPVVVYRDRSPDEIRDISIIRRVDGQWTQPAIVHADGWKIEGCPVNGPAVDAKGANVAVVWFTGAKDRERVNIAFSSDSGATFSAPVQVDDGNPMGHVDVAMTSYGAAIVTWMEREKGEGAAILLREITPDGKRSEPLVVAQTTSARTASFPRMVAVGDDVVLTWTDIAEPSQVRVARAHFGK
ncbi:MAG: sialidase family protein [Hyphomonadaceae bacterium]